MHRLGGRLVDQELDGNFLTVRSDPLAVLDRIARIAQELGYTQISVSHQVSPMMKWVSRGDTTVVDAYLSPILRRYVEQVAAEMPGVPLYFMQSSGGLTDAHAFQGKDAILSGPAGGIVGSVLRVIYGNGNRITQEPGVVAISYEMIHDTRVFYTDGRPHTPEEDAYASWNGDTVGFWDGDILVTHTKYLMSGQYQRGVQPNYSDMVQTVERWHKTDPKTLQVDVWIYDPVNLAKPWYTRQSYTQLTNDDYSLRLRYWDCRENQNNAIIVTENGTSQFPDFTFVDDDAAKSSDKDVKKQAADKAAAEKKTGR